MKKSLFIAALATLALASCSKNEVIELQQDQIKFSAVADNASRGTVVKASNLGSFHVWGWVEDDGVGTDYEALYINDVIYSGTEVTPATDPVTYTAPYESTTPYWWPKGAMKFYAINTNKELEEASGSTFNFNSGNSFTFNTQNIPSKQIDLIYAAKFGATKVETQELNFRHALSQIVFELGLDEAGTSLPLEVIVNSITLTDIDKIATFTMPTATTVNNLSVDSKTEPSYDDTWGGWTNNDGVHGDTDVFNFALTTSATIRNGKFSESELATTFTDGYVAYGGTDDQRWFMIPQKLEGSTLVVNCDIYAKGENKVKVHTGNLTYNFDTEAEWKQGMKYVYKLKFGAALQLIKFSVTVDEYQTDDEIINVPVE